MFSLQIVLGCFFNRKNGKGRSNKCLWGGRDSSVLTCVESSVSREEREKQGQAERWAGWNKETELSYEERRQTADNCLVCVTKRRPADATSSWQHRQLIWKFTSIWTSKGSAVCSSNMMKSCWKRKIDYTQMFSVHVIFSCSSWLLRCDYCIADAKYPCFNSNTALL